MQNREIRERGHRRDTQKERQTEKRTERAKETDWQRGTQRERLRHCEDLNIKNTFHLEKSRSTQHCVYWLTSNLLTSAGMRL